MLCIKLDRNRWAVGWENHGAGPVVELGDGECQIRCGLSCIHTLPLLLPFVVQVEHQRHLRQLAEDEAKLTAQQLQLQAERQAVAAAATRQAVQGQAQQQTER
jgi:hypothetical protein